MDDYNDKADVMAEANSEEGDAFAEEATNVPIKRMSLARMLETDGKYLEWAMHLDPIASMEFMKNGGAVGNPSPI